MKGIIRLILAVIIILSIPLASFAGQMFHPDKSGDELLRSLIDTKARSFQLKTYNDDLTGSSIRYSIYFPENYSHAKKYPVIFFIADGSSVGKAPEFSLTQGLGALVWTEYDCIIIVPSYNETLLDDHKGFVLSDYLELTGRFVRHSVNNYSIDSSRVYATGQSMGCMTFLVLASKYPDMFTACMFVSGQWDINSLEGLKGQKFIYIASMGDDKASKGQQEVIDMFSNSDIPFTHYRNINAKSPALNIPNEQQVNFITFRAGTTLPDGTEASYSEHMTSFDYAYRIKALRDWLISQSK